MFIPNKLYPFELGDQIYPVTKETTNVLADAPHRIMLLQGSIDPDPASALIWLSHGGAPVAPSDPTPQTAT